MFLVSYTVNSRLLSLTMVSPKPPPSLLGECMSTPMVNSTRLACRNMLHGEAGDVTAMKPTVDDHCGCRWRRGQGMSPMTRLTVMAVTMRTLAGTVMRLDADFGEATPVGRSLMTKPLPARLEKRLV